MCTVFCTYISNTIFQKFTHDQIQSFGVPKTVRISWNVKCSAQESLSYDYFLKQSNIFLLFKKLYIPLYMMMIHLLRS